MWIKTQDGDLLNLANVGRIYEDGPVLMAWLTSGIPVPVIEFYVAGDDATPEIEAVRTAVNSIASAIADGMTIINVMDMVTAPEGI